MTEAAGTAWIRDGFIGARSAGCSELRMLEDESFKANLSFALFFNGVYVTCTVCAYTRTYLCATVRHVMDVCMHGCMYVWVYIYRSSSDVYQRTSEQL